MTNKHIYNALKWAITMTAEVFETLPEHMQEQVIHLIETHKESTNERLQKV